MKKMNFFGILCGLFLLTLFTSCNNDDSPSYEKKSIDNPELVAALQKQGFSFDKNNSLELNNKVTSLTSLDLSNSELKNLKGLEVFPKLTEVNLSGNDFGSSFDFSQLPAQIQKVNLSNTKIYEYKGLVDVDFDKGNIKVLRKMEQIILPYTARFNVEALPFYFKEKGAVADMQMQDKQGNAQKYTTLREIPDELLRTYLKRAFSSKFEGDKLDLYKNFSLEQKNIKMNVSNSKDAGLFWVEKELFDKKYTTLEGVEYLVNDPRYEGQMWAWIGRDESYTLEYLKPGAKFTGFFIINVNTPILDLSNGKSIVQFSTANNKAIKKVDLSASEKLMQRGTNGTGGWFQGDMIILTNCPELEEIIFPTLKDPKLADMDGVTFGLLPKLKTNLDLSQINATYAMYIFALPENIKIIYPEDIEYFMSNAVRDDENGYLNFAIDEDTYNRQSTKDFIKKYAKWVDVDDNKINPHTYRPDDNDFKDMNNVSYGIKKYNFVTKKDN